MQHATLQQLEAGLPHVLASPTSQGRLLWIVKRTGTGEREVLHEGELSLVDGLVGDNWKARGSSRTADGSAHPELQLTLMNARVSALVAGTQDCWALAGDQLYVDLDLSQEQLPAGSRLTIGSAVIEITRYPHTGCKKFTSRYGTDATTFVNSEQGRALRLRGVNARVVRPGKIRVGDAVAREP